MTDVSHPDQPHCPTCGWRAVEVIHTQSNAAEYRCEHKHRWVRLANGAEVAIDSQAPLGYFVEHADDELLDALSKGEAKHASIAEKPEWPACAKCGAPMIVARLTHELKQGCVDGCDAPIVTPPHGEGCAWLNGGACNCALSASIVIDTTDQHGEPITVAVWGDDEPLGWRNPDAADPLADVRGALDALKETATLARQSLLAIKLLQRIVNDRDEYVHLGEESITLDGRWNLSPAEHALLKSLGAVQG